MRSPARRRVFLFVVVFGLVLSGVAVAPGSAADPVFVETDVTRDTTWTPAEGPYRVVANVSVAENATLTIEEGTEVQLAEGISLSVEGTLVASGTEGNPVTFTAPSSVQRPGSWGSIGADGPASSNITLRHVTLAYGTSGVHVAHPDASVALEQTTFADLSADGLHISEADAGTAVSVSDAAFQRVEGDGIEAVGPAADHIDAVRNWEVDGSSFESIGEDGIDVRGETVRGLEIRTNRFADVGGAAVGVGAIDLRSTSMTGNSIQAASRGVLVRTESIGELALDENRISEGGIGIEVASRTNVERLQIRDNVVRESGTGIVIGHDSIGDSFFSFRATVTRNELTDNAGDGLRFQTGPFSSSAFAVHNNTMEDNGGHGARFAVVTLRNARVADNQLRRNGVAGLTVGGRHVRSTVIRDNLVRSNRGSGIDIDATREITGLEIHDNRLLDNAGVGLAVANGEPAEGEYVIRENLVAANAYGIYAAGPGTARIERNEIVFNTYGLGAPVPIEAADPGVGVVVADGQDNFYLVDNDIYGHRVGLYITTGGTVEAATNYWGADSGPYHQSINPEGEGDAVVTDRGWADIIHAETERIGREHARPIARIEVDPVPARPGDSVTVSAAGSSDADGRVDTYQFTIGGDAFVTTEPTRSVTYEEPGSYQLSVVVEDDLGIESLAPATATVAVETEPTATATTTTTSDDETTPDGTTTPPGEQRDRGAFGALLSIGGLLGAVFYLLALGLGSVGMYQTMAEDPLTVDGREIHAFAAGGILVWILGSFVGPAALLEVAAVGLGAWLGLTVVAFALARGT